MDKRKPLFIYDCDGTLQAPKMLVYLTSSAKLNESREEFFKEHENDKNALFPGMKELIDYTAKIGNNVLLSGGDPQNDACSELKELFPCFKNWQFEGKDVPFGQIPDGCSKETQELADVLKETFNPSMVVVIGNEECEAKLAKNMEMGKEEIFFLKGKAPTASEKERCQNIADMSGDATSKVICYDSTEATDQMKQAIEEQEKSLTQKRIKAAATKKHFAKTA